ncbi:hypothetical protein FNH22_15095 [Fulvivirga sp. M361]|uniref:hypothetical protein n=1 Tax=Fulvivirga sp. M361 TaxID=2594266 RepID=UPI00117B7850|nr:hypothetical protein [Fulvivirga sp. M361]TRX57734.1 hypothetical protein FNH22_15095 [Fulvivirga sp. M361]
MITRNQIISILIIFLSVSSAYAQEVPWTFTPSALSHTIFISKENVPTISQVPLDSGDYIGVFFLDDNQKAQNAGFTQWKGNDTFITAYGDDGITDGFQPGEVFGFRIWRRVNECTLLEFDVDFLTGGIYNSAGEFQTNGISGISKLAGTPIGITYSTAALCTGDPILVPDVPDNTEQTFFSSSNGLWLDGNTGTVDPAQSEAGIYTISFQSTNCLLSDEFEITIREAPIVDLATLFSGCDSVFIDVGEDTEYNYRWVNEDTSDGIGQSAEITIKNSGNYTLRVTNSNQCTLEKTIEVLVSSPISIDNINLEKNFIPCGTEGELIIKLESTTGSIPPLSFTMENITGNVFTSSNGIFGSLPEGNYQLTVSDSLKCLSESYSVEFRNQQSCKNAVLTPNNDGSLESLYIEENGLAKIYDRNGVIRNEIIIPAYWDGRNESGNVLPMGTYLIIVNGTKKMTVTIVK